MIWKKSGGTLCFSWIPLSAWLTVCKSTEERQTCHLLHKLTMYFLQDLGLDDDIAEDDRQGGAQKASIADLFGDSDEE